MMDQPTHRLTEDGVREELQRHPHLLLKLAENALVVAESLRDNYFKNTAKFVSALRRAIQETLAGKRTEAILTPRTVGDLKWADVQGEVVTFIDGGIGSVQISSQVPILLRVGSYSVRTGEKRLAEREHFGYYPVILGDLQGGSKERKDFPDIIRITAELLGGLSALERTPDLRVLMFHGPLVYLVGNYAGHTPFTEKDVDLFLSHYAPSATVGRDIKEEFLHEAYVEIYPKMSPGNFVRWIKQRVFEPLSWMAYLYRRLIREAQKRSPVPIVVGVVERGGLREFCETCMLESVFHGLRLKGNGEYFNEIYGRSDLTSPRALLDRLGYTDTLLMAMLLQPGECSDPWVIRKYDGLRRGEMSLPGESSTTTVDFSVLANERVGFPAVTGTYVHVSETTEPIRVEVFGELGNEQIITAARRVCLYSRLLPGYGFPVGLDIADKYSKVPSWLTDAYGKLIRHQLGVSLQRGEINDGEMRRILVQAIYMTHRDWLFRPRN